MAHKTRVHSLAKEYGLASARILQELRAIGEFVESASSAIEPPVESRLRARLEAIPDADKKMRRPVRRAESIEPPSTARAAQSTISSALADRGEVVRTMPRAKFRPFEWYRGDPPTGLAQFILENFVVPQRDDQDRRHLRPGRYFAREIDRAEKLARHWGATLLDGWTYDDIMEWAHTGMPVEQAIAIKQAGVHPSELGWHYEDQGRGDLHWRLVAGRMTLDEVILEAIARRDRTG